MGRRVQTVKRVTSHILATQIYIFLKNDTNIKFDV